MISSEWGIGRGDIIVGGRRGGAGGEGVPSVVESPPVTRHDSRLEYIGGGIRSHGVTITVFGLSQRGATCSMSASRRGNSRAWRGFLSAVYIPTSYSFIRPRSGSNQLQQLIPWRRIYALLVSNALEFDRVIGSCRLLHYNIISLPPAV